MPRIFSRRPGGLEEPFILHNVDVLSTIDLGRMVRFHTEQHALATLAVQERETSRYLLFDEHGQLCGRRTGQDGETSNWSGPRIQCRRWPFPASMSSLPASLP